MGQDNEETVKFTEADMHLLFDEMYYALRVHVSEQIAVATMKKILRRWQEGMFSDRDETDC